ncbi:MAG: Sulfotransferase protein [Acidimicrobiales bacterium]|nr:Sulfotransferase protein [Acidimicrobiales bacterium]
MVHYRDVVSDNGRWDGFAFRDGDIVISTAAKCGTTWTQMVCGLLVFQTLEFDRPLDRISPWLDMVTRDLAGVVADLEAQTHRRFIKTHTPLDGVPWDDRVTYIGVGRDPRDVALSMDNHMANMDLGVLLAARERVVGNDDLAELFPDGPPVPEATEIGRFWAWVDAEDDGRGNSLAITLHHFATFWTARDRPNVVLLHYDDLKADLEGQMRGLAARLGIEVAESRWPALVEAATFDRMRARADVVVPNAADTLWLENRQFFNKGTSGQWRDLIDGEGLGRYAARVDELGVDPELVEWAHRGPILA